MSSPFFLSAFFLIMIQLFSFSPGSTPEQQQALILHGIEAPAPAAEPPAPAPAPAAAEPKKKASKKAAVRARDEEGKYLGDDPATPEVDEAWVEVDREN